MPIADPLILVAVVSLSLFIFVGVGLAARGILWQMLQARRSRQRLRQVHPSPVPLVMHVSPSTETCLTVGAGVVAPLTVLAGTVVVDTGPAIAEQGAVRRGLAERPAHPGSGAPQVATEHAHMVLEHTHVMTGHRQGAVLRTKISTLHLQAAVLHPASHTHTLFFRGPF